jgi:hypothetical protein
MIKVTIKGVTFQCANAHEAVRLLKWLRVDKARDRRIRRGYVKAKRAKEKE